MNTNDHEDYRCPCCMNFIYDIYECDNKHIICGNCYMKINECPLCRNKKIQKSCIKTGNDIAMKECKNKQKGCNLLLYHFDNEHEHDCMYNPFHCKFCGIDVGNTSFQSIINHYKSDCINTFNVLKYGHNKMENGETGGRKYHLQSIPVQLNLINVDDQYIIIMTPKPSQKKIKFIVFSTNDKYKLSNYGIKIFNASNEIVLESKIYYKKMNEFPIPFDKVQIANNLLNLVIENVFILNRRKPEQCQIGDTTFVRTYTVSGEPGSAGNWTKEDFDKMCDKFSRIFE